VTTGVEPGVTCCGDPGVTTGLEPGVASRGVPVEGAGNEPGDARRGWDPGLVTGGVTRGGKRCAGLPRGGVGVSCVVVEFGTGACARRTRVVVVPGAMARAEAARSSVMFIMEGAGGFSETLSRFAHSPQASIPNALERALVRNVLVSWAMGCEVRSTRAHCRRPDDA
jgi:hypothetical protein